MENNINQTVDIKAINEKIEKESAFIDLLTLETVSYTHLTLPTNREV